MCFTITKFLRSYPHEDDPIEITCANECRSGRQNHYKDLPSKSGQRSCFFIYPRHESMSVSHEKEGHLKIQFNGCLRTHPLEERAQIHLKTKDELEKKTTNAKPSFTWREKRGSGLSIFASFFLEQCYIQSLLRTPCALYWYDWLD